MQVEQAEQRLQALKAQVLLLEQQLDLKRRLQVVQERQAQIYQAKMLEALRELHQARQRPRPTGPQGSMMATKDSFRAKGGKVRRMRSTLIRIWKSWWERRPTRS